MKSQHALNSQQSSLGQVARQCNSPSVGHSRPAMQFPSLGFSRAIKMIGPERDAMHMRIEATMCRFSSTIFLCSSRGEIGSLAGFRTLQFAAHKNWALHRRAVAVAVRCGRSHCALRAGATDGNPCDRPQGQSLQVRASGVADEGRAHGNHSKRLCFRFLLPHFIFVVT